MIETERDLNPEIVWQTTEMAKLIKQYFRECSADPERCSDIREGAKIVLMPPDEPGNQRLRAANQKIVELNVRNGWDYLVWVVGEMRLGEQVGVSKSGAPVYR